MNPECTIETGSSAESYRLGIQQVTENVFETMLATAVTMLEGATEAAPHAEFTAAIFYAGLWKGALLVECSEQQARAWSSKIMEIPEPTSEDARDGLGELTNILAGNLKPLLPPGVSISTPSVVEGTEYSLRVFGSPIIEQIDFADERGRFRVTLAREVAS